MLGTTSPADLHGLLEKIHATKVQLVLEFTGAGSASLAWLHSLGGSSRTVLEASDRYATSSLADAIGYMPDKFTGADTSVALARVARSRARFLAGEGSPVIGVAASATIATDRSKRGQHRAVIAQTGPLGVQLLELVLDKGARDRAGEEELVSRLILSAIADGCGLLERPGLGLGAGDDLAESFRPDDDAVRLLEQDGALLVRPDLAVEGAAGLSGRLILSGSFNPLHEGHLGLAAAAAELTGLEPVFELPLRNADKPLLDLAETQRRAMQFAGQAPLLLTREPLFVGKARLFPGSTFVIGADTATRLLDPRFYGPEGPGEALRELDALGARFLVAGRKRGDGFAVLGELAVPAEHAHLFSEVAGFRNDISSTELRAGRRG